MKRRAGSVNVRKRPKQRRAASSRDKILTASAIILEESGVEGFNTNEISARSGVTIGSIYHLYPNKEAILLELCSSWLSTITVQYEKFEELDLSNSTTKDFWGNLIDLLYQAYKSTKGLQAITQATEIWPHLKELEVKYDATVVVRYSSYLQVLGIQAGKAERRRLSLLILNMIHFGLMLTVSRPKREVRRNLDDLIGNLTALVQRHADP